MRLEYLLGGGSTRQSGPSRTGMVLVSYRIPLAMPYISPRPQPTSSTEPPSIPHSSVSPAARSRNPYRCCFEGGSAPETRLDSALGLLCFSCKPPHASRTGQSRSQRHGEIRPARGTSVWRPGTGVLDAIFHEGKQLKGMKMSKMLRCGRLSIILVELPPRLALAQWCHCVVPSFPLAENFMEQVGSHNRLLRLNHRATSPRLQLACGVMPPLAQRKTAQMVEETLSEVHFRGGYWPLDADRLFKGARFNDDCLEDFSFPRSSSSLSQASP